MLRGRELGAGRPGSSLSVAKQRVDNYAAGFLKAGAAAVVADGHRGPVDYLRSLFTTDQTLEAWWLSQPNATGNQFSFASSADFWRDRDDGSGRPGPLLPRHDRRPDRRARPTWSRATRAPCPPGAIRCSSVFGDIWSSSFVASIQWIYDEGITAGCAPDAYCPRSAVSRGQMASFLSRALSLPATEADHFSDDDGLTHEADINRLAESGITGGCAPGRFCRTAAVSRAQMAAFLVRALHLPPATKDYFSDDDGNSLEGSINALAEAGLTGGCGGSRYCPGASVSREQMAAFLKRAFGPA